MSERYHDPIFDLPPEVDDINYPEAVVIANTNIRVTPLLYAALVHDCKSRNMQLPNYLRAVLENWAVENQLYLEVT